MNKIRFDGWPLYVDYIDAHADIKTELLDLIEAQPADREEQVTKSDWNKNNLNAQYFKLLKPHLKEFVNSLSDELGYDDLGLQPHYQNYWFHQYEHESQHGWHIHSDCLFSCVYYLEFPPGSPKTVFKNASNKKKSLDLKEGSIVAFPSQLIHCSPMNTTKSRKTIVAFNLNFKKSS